MEHWIGYYAAFYALGVIVSFMMQCGAGAYVFAVINLLTTLPLILHAWGVL